MKQIHHVEENLKTATVAPAIWQQYANLFKES